jgi:phospholipid transport system substrate-binding protein
MKTFKIIFSLALAFIMFSNPAFAADSNPVSMLENIANSMISNLQKNKVTLQSNRQYVYTLANRLVVPHVDASEMSRRVLPPQTWQSATPAQRSSFQHEFIELLVHTYASALAAYTDQTVQFFPVRGGYAGKRTVEVSSQIVSASGAPPVSVRYRLINSGGWKLYDMSVEGVSVIESFRSQFADVLSQGDINALIKRLSQHNNNPSD